MNEFDKDSNSFDEQETGELKRSYTEENSYDEVSDTAETSTYGNTSTRDYLNQIAQRAQQQAYENSANQYNANFEGSTSKQYTTDQHGGYNYNSGAANGYGYNAGNGYQGSGYTSYADNSQAAAQGDSEDAAAKAARKAAEKVRLKEEKKNARAQKKYTRKNKRKSSKVLKVAGKATGLVACAAVFGLVAGGVFQYVSRDTLAELKNANTSEITSEEVTEKASTEQQDKDTSIEATTVLSSSSGMDVSAIASNAMPSVVAIHITAVEEINQGFFGSYQYETEGSGSGIIIDENDTELLIVTNNHVVSDAETVSVDFIDV
jgi:serine protease Do